MVLKTFEIRHLSKIKYSCPIGQYFALCLIDYVFWNVDLFNFIGVNHGSFKN
tara:strand:- start:329 stop:484 length:156 start_codon:yes stop_codon:yes gene_type:complete